jgi:acylphosphatase
MKIIATGVVQGVGYRWHILEAAKKLNLCGTIRNLRDGSVETWAEGEQDDLSSLVGVIWKGPALARVRDLDIHWSEGPRQWQDFQVIS